MTTTPRTLQVRRTERITPRMVRVTLGGDELAGFPGDGPDQRIRMFFPADGQGRPALPRGSSGGPVWPPGQPRPAMRTYTVRRFDPAAGELDVDFVLHDGAGPAATWAQRATVGDWVGVSDPGGRFSPDPDVDVLLLVGDESALPAIGTILTELPALARVEAFVEVADEAEQQPLGTAAELRTHWLHRGGADPGTTLTAAVRAAQLPPGRYQAWVSGEASAVRGLRDHLLDDRGLDRRQVYATNYWRHRA
jgi:NADPH-dependent ferric siderophore reductase